MHEPLDLMRGVSPGTPVGGCSLDQIILGRGAARHIHLLCFLLRPNAEPVKRFETRSYDAFCASSSTGTGSLIHATVGSFGGCGWRWRNRAGFAA